MAITTLARKTGKIIYFIFIFLTLGRTIPRPEAYLDYEIARKICHFFYGSINADSMYDTFFYIAFGTVLLFSVAFYILTVKLIKITRSK